MSLNICIDYVGNRKRRVDPSLRIKHGRDMSCIRICTFTTLAFFLFQGCGVVTLPDLDPDGMPLDGFAAVELDAGTTGTDAVDSAIVSRCPVPADFSLSWNTPMKIPIETGDLQYSPTISCDGKELYLHSAGPEYFDIYMAQRSTLAAPWSEPVIIELDTGSERDPEIGPDLDSSTELLYTRDQAIRVATRSAPDRPWAEVGELFAGTSPALTGDGLTLYYVNNYRLHRRRRASPEATWSEPEEVSTLFSYQQVTVSANGSTVLVSSPLEAAASRVQVWRETKGWLNLPELDAMRSCDFTWHGDLLCSDSREIYYIANRQL